MSKRLWMDRSRDPRVRSSDEGKGDNSSSFLNGKAPPQFSASAEKNLQRFSSMIASFPAQSDFLPPPAKKNSSNPLFNAAYFDKFGFDFRMFVEHLKVDDGINATYKSNILTMLNLQHGDAGNLQRYIDGELPRMKGKMEKQAAQLRLLGDENEELRKQLDADHQEFGRQRGLYDVAEQKLHDAAIREAQLQKNIDHLKKCVQERDEIRDRMLADMERIKKEKIAEFERDRAELLRKKDMLSKLVNSIKAAAAATLAKEGKATKEN